jgi:acetylornithine aminotransferase
MQVRRRVQSHLDRIRAAHPDWISGPFGEGAMIAFTPFDGSDATAKKLLAALFDAGVIAFLCGGTPTRLRFLPPVAAVTDAHLDTACHILEQVLAQHARQT